MVRILHTSDWHLGHTWGGRSRKAEFDRFLDWIIDLLQREKVDMLIVSGDIFDNSAPTPGVLSQYFGFLRRVAIACRKTVIVAGNHDSPHLLDAPKDLLNEFNVHVIGSASETPEQAIIVLKDDADQPELIVAAVPFLRERDLRRSKPGESLETREQKCLEGLRRHYADICDAAEKIRNGKFVPLIATGHLAVAGSTTTEGVREIHIGTLGKVGIDVFPNEIDYLALGHIHLSYGICGAESRRYSGSPIPLGFDEAGCEKSVLLVDFEGRDFSVRKIPVPFFSKIVRIEGSIKEIEKALKSLGETLQDAPKESTPVYVEVTYTGLDAATDLIQKIDEFAAEMGENVHISRIRNNAAISRVRLYSETTETLEQLEPIDVFRRLLTDVQAKREKDKKTEPFDESFENELVAAYNEILQNILSEP